MAGRALDLAPRTFSGLYALTVVELLADMGLHEQPALEALGLPRTKLEDPRTRIADDRVRALFALAEAQLGKPLVGLETGFAFRVSQFTQTGSVLACAPTLREGGLVNARYAPLAETSGLSELVETSLGGERAWALRWTPDADAGAHRHITELVLGGYATTVRWLGWAMGWTLPAVRMRHARPPETQAGEVAAGYRRIFEVDPEFGALHNEVVLPVGSIDVELPTHAPRLFARLSQRLDRVMFGGGKGAELDALRLALRRELAEGRTTRAAVAGAMGTTLAALDRTLSTSDTSFRALVDEVRRERFDVLAERGLGLAEIAGELGYNDQAALTRAFRRWHGTTPGRHLSAL